jgi:hypothetical protein
MLYDFKNIGNITMTIARADCIRGGETLDLTLDVGSLTFVTEEEQIDVCVNNTSTTTVNAEADSPGGTPCFDSFTYNLITKVEC